MKDSLSTVLHTVTWLRPMLSPAIGVLAFLLFLSSTPPPSSSQEILRSQLSQGFGKNKVQYRGFEWWKIQTKHLEIYYEPDYDWLAEKAAVMLEEGYDRISRDLRHDLSTVPPIIIFQSHYDFEQTNIVSDILPPGVGGFAEALRYRAVVPFNGDLEEFRHVLVHELTHIFQYDILYKGPLKGLTNRVNSPPSWIMEGMAEYEGGNISTTDEMVLRDAVLSDGLVPLKQLDDFNALANVFLGYKEGQFLMHYIAEQHGVEPIRRMLREWGSTQSTSGLVQKLLGTDLAALDRSWAGHLKQKYWPLLKDRKFPGDLASQIPSDGNDLAYASPSWSLGGEMLAAIQTNGVDTDVALIRAKDGVTLKKVTAGMRGSAFVDLKGREGTVAWAPDGEQIAFVARKGRVDRIFIWDAYRSEITDELSFGDLQDIQEINSIAWSPDCRRLAFSASREGRADIYVARLSDRHLTQITDTPDIEDYPAWAPDNRRLAFSAKRGRRHDILVTVPDSASGISTLITSEGDDLWPRWHPDGDHVLFVSTRDGISDLFSYDIRSRTERQLTRTVSGLSDPAISQDGSKVAFIAYSRGRRGLYSMDLARAMARGDTSTVLFATRKSDPDSQILLAKPSPDSVSRSVSQSESQPVLYLSASGSAPIQEVTAGGPRESMVPPPLSDTSSTVSQRLSPRQLASASSDTTAVLPAAPTGAYTRSPYRTRLDMDAISSSVVFSNGFLSTVIQLSMSDLFGNHQLALAGDYTAQISKMNDFNFACVYTYVGHRIPVSAGVFNWTQFFGASRFVESDFGTVEQDETWADHQAGLLASASYPLNLYRRLDLGYSLINDRVEIVGGQAATVETPARSDTTTHLLRGAYVNDSVVYGPLGPSRGVQYYVSAGRAVGFSSSDREFTHLDIDYRRYIPAGGWSVLAFRLKGLASLGDNGITYHLGGPSFVSALGLGYDVSIGPLRGFGFGQFSGTRIALANIEYRVPLVRDLTFEWPGRWSLGSIEGTLFADAGSAWNRNSDLVLWVRPEHNLRLEDLKMALGFGAVVNFVLPLSIEFAKRTDLDGFSKGYRVHFSLGRSF